MDSSKLIVWFLGIVGLLSVAFAGAITVKGGNVPSAIDHIATAAVGALSGGMVIKGNSSEKPNS